MFTESKLAEVKHFLENTSPESSVYLGCDSMRLKKRGNWFALYTVVVVVHKDSKHGAKLFGYNVPCGSLRKKIACCRNDIWQCVLIPFLYTRLQPCAHQ